MKISFYLVTLTVLLALYTSCLSENSSVNWTINEIQSQYSGVIIDKYSKRDNDMYTHLKVKNSLNNEVVSFIPQPDIMKNAEIGDSIFKPKDENVLYLIKTNREKKSFFFIRIAKWKRKHKNFPEAWKNKWLSSSLYDTIN